IAKVQAEIKAQHDDQDFVNRLCQLPEHIEQLDSLRQQAYYRKYPIAPFLNACHVLGEGIDSQSLSENDRKLCAFLLAQRLQKVSSDPSFRMRHIMIFGNLEEKLNQWISNNPNF